MDVHPCEDGSKPKYLTTIRLRSNVFEDREMCLNIDNKSQMHYSAPVGLNLVISVFISRSGIYTWTLCTPKRPVTVNRTNIYMLDLSNPLFCWLGATILLVED